MDLYVSSDNQIAKTLAANLTVDEKEAIMAEPGRLIASNDIHVESAMTKMMGLKPSDRLVLGLCNQEYIMRKVRTILADEMGRAHSANKMENLIERVKRKAQDEVGPKEVEAKSESYGNAIFKGLLDLGYSQMDENNARVADVGREQGTEAAVKMMMNSAGGDYARMRSMYG